MSSKQTVLITGCTDGGIGSGLALEFQKRGYHVFATARNIEKMSKLKDLQNMTLLKLDVIEPLQIRAAVDTVEKATGGTLDFLVLNAAQGIVSPILDSNLDEVRALYEVNVFGPLAVTMKFAPLVMKAKGCMVFVTSMAGYMNVPFVGK